MAFDRMWWVQNVLPLTFDNSLSYYEVLAKVIWYLNGLSEEVSNVVKTLGTIEGIQDVEAYTQFLESIQNSIGSLASLDTDEKDDIVSAINEVLDVAKKAYVKPKDGIPESDLSEDLQIKINNQSVSSYNELSDKPSINGVTLKGNVTGDTLGLGTYSKPSGGIPESDLSTEVQEKLNQQSGGQTGTTNYNSLSNKPSINGVTLSGNKTPAELGLGTYSIPEGGIPMEALSTEVQEAIAAGGGSGGTSNYNALINKPSINGHTLIGNVTLDDLGADYYIKPASGIPESDLSDGVKEKLNATAGIAGNIDKFIADDNYSAGDLIYINGVLYKFTKNVLKGTELTEGDNIEKTNINSELSKMNEKIEVIESGEGPDSWYLSGKVHGKEATEPPVSLFEYFNAIGGEDYNIVVIPEANSYSEYWLRVYKRDGTAVEEWLVDTQANYVKRFTFTPDDTGEYYLEFKLRTGTGTQNPRTWTITIEYTQSQGISELWAQVNKASQLEPRVDAIETLVEEQQDELDENETEHETINDNIQTLYNTIANGLNIEGITVLLNYTAGIGLNSSGGLNYSSAAQHRITTVDFVRVENNFDYNIAEGYRLYLALYSENNEESFIRTVGWLTGEGTIDFSNANYARFCIASVGDIITLTPSDSDKVTLSSNTQLQKFYSDFNNYLEVIKLMINKENIIDENNLTENTRLDIRTNTEVSATNQFTTNMIKVMPGMIIKTNFCLSSNIYGHILYDINKNPKYGLPGIGENMTIIIPDKCYFIRFTISNLDRERAYAFFAINELIVNKTKWLAIGDSITEGVFSTAPNATSNFNNGWVQRLAVAKSYQLNFITHRGMGYTVAGGDGATIDDTWEQVDALNDDYNLVTIQLGINDYNTQASTAENIRTKASAFITNVADKFKTARVIVMTPFNAARHGDASTLYSYNQLHGDKTLKDIEDILSEICSNNGIECVKLSHNFVLNNYNINSMLIDGVHPSNECHTIIAKSMSNILDY